MDTLDSLRAFVVDAGACDSSTASLFFSQLETEQNQAVAICNKCDAKRECLALSIWQKESKGVWGGLKERERHKYLKSMERRRQAINALLGLNLQEVPAANVLRPPHLLKTA